MSFELTLDSWVTADSHFAHKNIQRYCDRPEDHFALMRRLWREQVQEDDIVLHLGDLVVYPKGEAWRYLDGLPGQKYLLLGNHDKEQRSFYAKWGFTVLDRPEIHWQEVVDHRGRRHQNPCLYWHSPTDGKRILFTHYPDPARLDWSVNVHGHIHNDRRAYDSLPERDYRNVGVEVVDFAPQRLRDVLYGDAYAGKLSGRDTWRDVDPALEAARQTRPGQPAQVRRPRR